MSRNRFASILALPAGLAILLASCGGGDDLAFNPENADDIAHDAVLSERDLADYDIELIAEDEFDDEDLEFGDTDTCAKIGDSIADLREDIEDKREGRARNEFEGSSGDVPFSVGSTVTIFSEKKIVDDTLKEYSRIIKGDEIEDCFKEIFEETGGGQFDVSIKSVDPSTKAPGNGAARKIEIAIKAGGESVTVITEVYVWSKDNAGVTLTFTGDASNYDDDVVAEIVDLQVDRLEDAAEG